AGLRFLQDDNGKGSTSEDAHAYLVGNGISRTGVSAAWDGFPLSHKTGKDGAPSCPRVVCASMSEDARAYIVGNGISRTGRVRTTRTSWIVNSRLLAAEGARNDNDKGKPFGTLRLPLRLAQGFGKSRAGSRTRSRAVPGMLAGKGARATQHLRA